MENSSQSPAVASSKPQKSTLWIWTTLWLTTLLDALLITIVFYLLLSVTGILAGVSTMVATTVLDLVALIAMAAGSFLAARYVLKKSIVPRMSAGKLAGLAILIPAIGGLGVRAIALLGNTTASTGDIVVSFAVTILSLALMYGIIRQQLATKGD